MENPNAFNFSSESNEAPETEESKDKKKKRRVRSFLESYLNDNKEETDDEESGDEEEEESSAPESLDTEEKKSIWDKLNENLVNRVVEEPEELEQTDEEHSSEELNYHQVEGLDKSVSDVESTEAEGPGQKEVKDNNVDENTTELSFSRASGESEELPPQEASELTNEDDHNAPEPATEIVYTRTPELDEEEPEHGIILPDLVSNNAEQEEPVIDLAEPDIVENQPDYQNERGYAEATAIDQPERVGKIVERVKTRHGGALTSLIVGEYLSRGRDRKLREEDARQKREVKNIKNRLGETEVAQKVLEKKQGEITPKVEKIERVVEQKSPFKLYRNIDAASTPPIELNLPSEKYAAQPEIQTQNIVPQEELKGLVPDEQIAERLRANPENRPEAVLHSVEQAAEKNIPIESLYEKRHETKGSTDSFYGGAAPQVSQSFSGTDQSMTTNHSAAASSQSSINNQPPEHIDSSYDIGKKPYSQAMAAGFWGAVVVLILLAVLALTR